MSVTISMEGNVVDLAWVCDQLHGSYWGAWLTDEQILGAIENSLCFWAHHYDGVEAVPDVDVNRFMGTAEELQAFTGAVGLTLEERVARLEVAVFGA